MPAFAAAQVHSHTRQQRQQQRQGPQTQPHVYTAGTQLAERASECMVVIPDIEWYSVILEYGSRYPPQGFIFRLGRAVTLILSYVGKDWNSL